MEQYFNEPTNQASSIRKISANDKFVLNLIISCVIGLLWGILIFLIDGFIIGTTRKKIDSPDLVKSGNKTSIPADKLVIAGRLILAAFVGYIISIPVEILAFKQEILAAIVEEDKNVKVTEDKSSSKTVLQNIISRIKEAEEKYKIADKAYHNYNTSGAKISNIPKDSQQYRITLLDRESEKNKAELALKEAQIEYEMCNSTRISCWTPNPGLMRLYKTIDKLDDKFLPWLIRFVFIFIDILPVLTKISKKTDNYDVAIASKESKKKANFKLEQITLNTEIEILENKFKFKKEKMEKLSKDIEDKIQENITV
nr:DUF4407 domain-containing protein [Scytonema sp. UIC 10036]